MLRQSPYRTGLQVITIMLSRGDVNMLGEAYAFCVIWSFAMKAFSVLVLQAIFMM
jgi:hypothetical protein